MQTAGKISNYDIPTAVTFLLAGLGLGSLLAMLLSPRDPSSVTPSGVNRNPRPLP